MEKIAILRWESGHVPQGLMQLEQLPGNSTNLASYPFPVKLVEVKGANTDTVILHPSQKLLEDMIQLAKELEKEGVITYLLPAFSRDQEKKIYIQNKIDENPKIACEILVEKKGYFFYCGPAGRVPEAIEKSLVKAIETVYGKTEEEAMNVLNEVKKEGRYVVEAWS